MVYITIQSCSYEDNEKIIILDVLVNLYYLCVPAAVSIWSILHSPEKSCQLQDYNTSIAICIYGCVFAVTIQARAPINNFRLCIRRSGTSASTNRVISRYLPYHARLRRGCSNIVEQSPAFRQRSVGTVQFRWRAPSSDEGCFVFRWVC